MDGQRLDRGPAGGRLVHDELHYTYNSSGFLQSIKNPCQQIWTINSSSPVSSVLDPLGRLTTYLYDGSGNIQGIQDVWPDHKLRR